MQPIISVVDLVKTYASGFQALKHIDLEIRRGEIFALLGPNGAGKTTLISNVCGIATPTSGTIRVDGDRAGLPGFGEGFAGALTGMTASAGLAWAVISGGAGHSMW